MMQSARDPLLTTTRAILWGLIVMMALAIIALLVSLPAAMIWQDDLLRWLDLSDRAMLGAVIGMLASLAVMLTLSLAMTELLRRIVVSLAHGDPFVPQNAQRLRDMGWLSILIQIVTLVGGAMAMAIEDAAGEVTTDYDLSLGGLLLPLVLFVLARVFQEGSRLRDDLEGTV